MTRHDQQSPRRGLFWLWHVVMFLLFATAGAAMPMYLTACDEAAAQDDYEDEGYGDEDEGYGDETEDSSEAPDETGESVDDSEADEEKPPPPRPSDPAAPVSVEYPMWNTVSPGEYLGYNQRASLIQRGKIVYDKYCVGCHGEKGDGKGPAASRLITQPRDFTSGIYKFRSTDSSSLPLEADLYRTIKRGLSRVSMPAFPLMPERDMVAVIEYIKAFYPDWDQRAAERKKIFVPLAPDDLDISERITRGRIVYTAMGCGKCHGNDGAGTGATQEVMPDSWGNDQKAFNFTRGALKGGSDPEDIYRTFHTGLISIMPTYGVDTLAFVTQEGYRAQEASVPEGERAIVDPFVKDFVTTEQLGELTETEKQEIGVRNSWDLVAFVIALREPISTREAVLGRPEKKQPTTEDAED